VFLNVRRGKVPASAQTAPSLESALRIALLTFALLAIIGVTLGHAARVSQPRVQDHGGMIRLKL
jgi:hypothetical protein